MKILKKSMKELASNPSNSAGEYEKPATCPHCSYGTDAPIQSKNEFDMDNGNALYAVTCRCTACNNTFFFAVYLQKGNLVAKVVSTYPSIMSTYENNLLKDLSNRFIDLMNQALRAESIGDIDLAATGYRMALECLVKDFAISSGADRDAVEKCILSDAIKKYLDDKEQIISADVVRILGNDYAHYKRRYPEHDLFVLRAYMDIFIKQVEVKVMLANPPVERQ